MLWLLLMHVSLSLTLIICNLTATYTTHYSTNWETNANIPNMKVYIIAAADENMGIGVDNRLPWSLKQEWKYYSRMTLQTESSDPEVQNVVLMGRRTWESIPEDSRPLYGRINAVLSSRKFDGPPGVLSYFTWEEAIEDLASLQKKSKIGKVWITGGTNVYKIAMESPICHRIYLTRIYADFKCDTFFPEINRNAYQLVTDPQVSDEMQMENGIKYKFEVYERIIPTINSYKR